MRQEENIVRCVWEHNGDDTLLYAVDYPGAFSRGRSLNEAIEKMPGELTSYLCWRDGEHNKCNEDILWEIDIFQENPCDLQVSDADSDVLFDTERLPLDQEEYEQLKALVLKSAQDFQRLYDRIPDKDTSVLPIRKTFYGQVPVTARQMYEHTKSVNAYYFGEINIDADNDGTIHECRLRGFDSLEKMAGYLQNSVIEGSYGELWTLRKVLRRFLWHDRIHAKAMYRMAKKTFGADAVTDVFHF